MGQLKKPEVSHVCAVFPYCVLLVTIHCMYVDANHFRAESVTKTDHRSHLFESNNHIAIENINHFAVIDHLIQAYTHGHCIPI